MLFNCFSKTMKNIVTIFDVQCTNYLNTFIALPRVYLYSKTFKTFMRQAQSNGTLCKENSPLELCDGCVQRD